MSIVDINEQRIRIAEACGWTMQPIGLMKKGDAWAVPETKHGHSCIPDYLSDLNAMHEAEGVLTNGQREAFCIALADICNRFADTTAKDGFCFIHATAAQRAEAFLRCLGKWTDA